MCEKYYTLSGGESQAGIPFDQNVVKGTALRTSTGVMLPDGADTDVRVEDTEENRGHVYVHSVRTSSANARIEYQSAIRVFAHPSAIWLRQELPVQRKRKVDLPACLLVAMFFAYNWL